VSATAGGKSAQSTRAGVIRTPARECLSASAQSELISGHRLFLPRHYRKIPRAWTHTHVRNVTAQRVQHDGITNVTSKDEKSHRQVMRAILNRTVTRLHRESIFVNLPETRNVMQGRNDSAVMRKLHSRHSRVIRALEPISFSLARQSSLIRR